MFVCAYVGNSHDVNLVHLLNMYCYSDDPSNSTLDIFDKSLIYNSIFIEEKCFIRRQDLICNS